MVNLFPITRRKMAEILPKRRTTIYFLSIFYYSWFNPMAWIDKKNPLTISFYASIFVLYWILKFTVLL